MDLTKFHGAVSLAQKTNLLDFGNVPLKLWVLFFVRLLILGHTGRAE